MYFLEHRVHQQEVSSVSGFLRAWQTETRQCLMLRRLLDGLWCRGSVDEQVPGCSQKRLFVPDYEAQMVAF